MTPQGFDSHLAVLAATTALLIYDYSITVSYEVERIWKRRFSGVTVLFILNRYVTLALAITSTIVMSFLDAIVKSDGSFSMGMAHNPDLCRTLTSVAAVMGVVSALSISAFATLRVWAIWRDNFRVIIPFAVLSLLPLGGNMYVISSIINQSLVSAGTFMPICNFLPPELGLGRSSYILSIVLQVATVVCETLVLVFTWIKTFTYWRVAKRLHVRAAITTLFLRDGTFYFIAMLSVNAFFYGYFKTYLPQSIYTLPQALLNSILITRFLLDLRGVNLSSSSGNQNSSSIQAASSLVIGNMGAPLRDGFPILSVCESCGLGHEELIEPREGASTDPLSFGSFHSKDILNT